MENLYDRLIGQLDTLVPFLALSHEEIFEIIQEKEAIWFPDNESDQMPETYRIYQVQIAHGAFLLGYSYFEAFLGDLVKEIYCRHPRMLPQDKQLKYSEILNREQDYRKIMSLMIDKEAFSLFYNSIEKVLEYLEKKLKLSISDIDDRNRIIEASLIRNCLVHNSARVDIRLEKVSKWNEGETIELQPPDVHGYGLAIRRVVWQVYKQAEISYLNDNK